MRHADRDCHWSHIDGSGFVSSGAAARQFGFEVAGQRMDCSRQIGCRRQTSNKRVIGGEEDRRERIGSHI